MARKTVILKPEREKIYEAMEIVRRAYWLQGCKTRPKGPIEPPTTEQYRIATQNLRDVLNECTTPRFRGKY